MQNLNIEKLSLRDYRCFESLDITFHKKLTVLVASNGLGKTSILDAIAVALGPFIGAFDEAVGKHFEPSDIRLHKVRQTATQEMEYAANGVHLAAEGQIPGHSFQFSDDDSSLIPWKRSLAGPTKAKTTIKDAKELVEYGKRLQKAVRTLGNSELLPLVAYYGTGRLWQQKKLTEGKLPRTSRTIGYTDCLDPASSYKSFVAWFHYWNFNLKDMLFSGQGDTPEFHEFAGYIASVQQAVDRCLLPTDWKRLEYSFKLKTLVAHHDQHGELPVELLSDGIRNMIGMVADIAFRATKLNAHLGMDAAKQTPGIVLIDEIDMHLHPEWQQVVLQSLMEAFPQVQFIVTTHSPQVLTSVDASSIRLLKEETDPETGERKTIVKPVDLQTKGVASSDVLHEIMGVNPIPPVKEAHLYADYTARIENGTHDDDDGLALRQKLDAHFGARHPLMLDADKLIRFQAFKLRKNTALQG